MSTSGHGWSLSGASKDAGSSADGPSSTPPSLETHEPIAIHVTGPEGPSKRLVARGGLVRIGRGPDSTILIDDRRVSRFHAVLHLEDPFMLVDLGSSNGTLVGAEWLPPKTARPLSFGETFSIGGWALVLRPSGLRPPPPERVLPPERLAERMSAPGTVAVRIRAERSSELPWVEAIVAQRLAGPTDWIARSGPSELVVGLMAFDGATFERDALADLASWNLAATIEPKL